AVVNVVYCRRMRLIVAASEAGAAGVALAAVLAAEPPTQTAQNGTQHCDKCRNYQQPELSETQWNNPPQSPKPQIACPSLAAQLPLLRVRGAVRVESRHRFLVNLYERMLEC